jgi:hypothetical protein
MGRFDDINILLQVADEQLQQIETEYNKSLINKVISPKLSVYIKNYLENLRSPLDYIANEICEKILLKTEISKTYFPISCENNKAFISHMSKNLPGLDVANTQLYGILEEFQPYSNFDIHELTKLSKFVNENKHNKLSPQTRTERKGLVIEFPGGSRISMGPGSSISGSGTIRSGDSWISPAGGIISGDSPARVGGGEVKQTVTRWISFTFATTDDDVLKLLKNCRKDVDKILNRVKPFLWP